jgi:transcriptional regulator with XRE-family HTH domain
MMAASSAHDASFRTLLDPDEMMFVAVRTPLSQRVVDARIVAATPHAAALFGYDTSTALEGQFTSLLHVLDDVQRARRRATLRALGQAAATECYEARIVRQTGEIQRVVKRVEQRQLGQDLVWITRLAPANPHTPFQPAPLPHTVPDAAMHMLFGWACLAEVDALLYWRTHRAYPTPPALGAVPPLGTLLQQARHTQGFSQQALAQRCTPLLGQPITPKHVSSLEHGHSLPSLPLLQVLVMVLDLDPAAVLAAQLETTATTTHVQPVVSHARNPRDPGPQDLLTRVQQATRHLAEVQQAHHDVLIAARQAGVSWRQLASATGLSPSRIRQLLGKILAP